MIPGEYKDLSIKEFTKAAEIYESDNAGVYKMCKKDYSDVLAELKKNHLPTLWFAAVEQVLICYLHLYYLQYRKRKKLLTYAIKSAILIVLVITNGLFYIWLLNYYQYTIK